MDKNGKQSAIRLLLALRKFKQAGYDGICL